MNLKFFKTEEMHKLLTEAYTADRKNRKNEEDRKNRNDEDLTYKASFSEEHDMDVVDVINNSGEIIELIPFDDAISVIENHLNIKIESYDMIELDTHGIGYALYL